MSDKKQSAQAENNKKMDQDYPIDHVPQSAGGFAAVTEAVPSAKMRVASAETAIVGTFASMGTQSCNLVPLCQECQNCLFCRINRLYDWQHHHALCRDHWWPGLSRPFETA